MDLLDSTIVNVAGPSLKDELQASPSALQWVIGGYTLTLGAGLVLGGRLADRYSRRNIFLFGLISFTLSSLLCAIAPSIESLIAFRLIQGFAGALVLPHVIGFIRDVFPPEELGKAFAIFGPVFGLGGILGPIIGGFLIDGDIASTGWRAVFIVNIPIGIINIALAWKYLPKRASDHSIKIDLLGSLLIIVSSSKSFRPPTFL
jgi:EmrB/QacA subfamily drug resistance transporter